MNELFEFKDAILTVHLPQDLDHPQSDWIRKETDRIMSRTYVKRIVFDFENTEFMDSSGIGLIMGRYRALGMGQKCIMAVNAGSHIDKLLHLSGVHRYMEIQRAEEEGEDYGFFQHIDTAGRTCPVFVWNAGYGRWPGKGIRRKTGTDS